jgi:hypothetical protein
VDASQVGVLASISFGIVLVYYILLEGYLGQEEFDRG